MTNHRLGVYFAPTHGRQSDRDYIAALQPPVIRLLDPDVQQIADMHALAPSAVIAPRTWAIDDNNHSAVKALMADPAATGRDHAQQYRGQWDRWQREAGERGLTLPAVDRIMFNSANEPNQGGTPDRIAVYSIAFLNHCTELGIRGSAPCLGVGWPNNTGPDTPVDWSPYAGMVEPIKRGQHWLAVHEYFYKTGPQDTWRWWAGRHRQCPFDVPILLGEIGIDNYVASERWKQDGGERGWVGNVSPEAYAEMIEQHIRGCDTRVVAALPFITDYANNSWDSFDTHEAHGALLARKDRMVPQARFTAQTPTPDEPDTYIPVVTGPQTGPPPTVAPPGSGLSIRTVYVTAPAGLNVRDDADENATRITGLPYRAQIQVTERRGDWLRMPGFGWVHGNYVSETEPPPLPPVVPRPQPPAQPTDKWERSYAFTARWEGGYQNVHNDRGNWTSGQVGVGELKGTKYGISAASYPHLDIRNLTKEQAKAIYFRDYWQASGADKLDWPGCLVVFDSAVLHGVGRARQWVQEAGPNPLHFAARRLRSYTGMGNWKFWGIAWVKRVADLLEEAAGL